MDEKQPHDGFSLTIEFSYHGRYPHNIPKETLDNLGKEIAELTISHFLPTVKKGEEVPLEILRQQAFDKAKKWHDDHKVYPDPVGEFQKVSDKALALIMARLKHPYGPTIAHELHPIYHFTLGIPV